jgi:HEAT repeat protein
MERAVAASSLGHRTATTPEDRDELERLVRSDPDARVRSAALGALIQIAVAPRAGARRQAGITWRAAADDPDATVRRRAAELAPALAGTAPVGALVVLLADEEPLVAEAAAFALGEHPTAGVTAITALGHAASDHEDPLVREAAVAALGARGEPSTLPIVLRACDDKPAVRRRAVLALAAFEGPDVEARLRAALTDRDWQVRQAAEDLLGGQ